MPGALAPSPAPSVRQAVAAATSAGGEVHRPAVMMLRVLPPLKSIPVMYLVHCLASAQLSGGAAMAQSPRTPAALLRQVAAAAAERWGGRRWRSGPSAACNLPLTT